MMCTGVCPSQLHLILWQRTEEGTLCFCKCCHMWAESPLSLLRVTACAVPQDDAAGPWALGVLQLHKHRSQRPFLRQPRAHVYAVSVCVAVWNNFIFLLSRFYRLCAVYGWVWMKELIYIHSCLNFTSWHIVEPGSSKAEKSCKRQFKIHGGRHCPSVLCGAVGPDDWQIKLRMMCFCSFSSIGHFHFAICLIR